MSESIAAILGVLLGALLAEGLRVNGEIRRQRAWWAGLKAALLYSRKVADGYVNAKTPVAAPLTRLELAPYQAAMTELTAAGAITEDEITVLYDHLDQAQQFNRGLELAQAAATLVATPTNAEQQQNALAALADEYGRARKKAKRLIAGAPEEPTRYDKAMNVVYARMDVPWLQLARSYFSGEPARPPAHL